MQLQFLDAERREGERLYVQVIGCVPGASILVTTPQIGGQAMPVRESQPLTARVFSGERALAFSSSVLRVCTTPYRYLHLAYPQNVAQVLVRNARRIGVGIPVEVSNEQPERNLQGKTAATISDFSATGALLHSASPLGEVSDRLVILTRLPLERLDEQAVTLLASIRNVLDQGEAAQGERYRYGVEFGALEVSSALALRAFMYEHLLGGSQP